MSAYEHLESNYGVSFPFAHDLFECLTLDDVDTRFEQVLGYFDNNVTKLLIYVGRYLGQRPISSALFKQHKQSSAQHYNDFQFWRAGFFGNEECPGMNEQEKKALEEAQEDQAQQDMLAMQELRRRSHAVGLQKKMKSEEGRRLSQVEKNAYVVDAAVELAKQEEQEDQELGIGKLFDQDEEEEQKKWKHLPYIAIAGDEVDEALAEQVNIYEIDVNIKRIVQKGKKKKKNKILYKINKKKYAVRYIHNVLLVKQTVADKKDPKKKSTKWVELIPMLRELAGMKPIHSEEIQKEVQKAKADLSKKKAKGSKIKIHKKKWAAKDEEA